MVMLVITILFGLCALATASQVDNGVSAAILSDMFPPSECASASSTNSTSFHFDWNKIDPSISKWDAMSAPYEEDLFLAEMEHTNENVNKTWKIRIGSGSNIYSFIAAFGEAVPPQHHEKGHLWMKCGKRLV
eukprot:m.109740 g.109740  ORF g.109740 m.109740 type:complete len:132 (+) comp22695_c2_seq7:24-419(+)